MTIKKVRFKWHMIYLGCIYRMPKKFILFLIVNFIIAIKLQINDIDEFKKAISSMEKNSFEQVTGIGFCCLTKFRINSFLKKYDQSNAIRNPNHLFDWTIINNYTLLGEAISNNLNDTFGLEYLSLKKYPNTPTVILHNEKYRISFNHALDGLSEISHQRGFTREEFVKYYHLIEKKFIHLAENSRKAFFDSRRTLYCGLGHNLSWQKKKDYINFMHALKSKRDNNFLILILVIGNTPMETRNDFDKILEGNLIFHEIKTYEYHDWNSSPSVNQWDDIFKITLAKYELII